MKQAFLLLKGLKAEIDGNPAIKEELVTLATEFAQSKFSGIVLLFAEEAIKMI